MFKAVVTFERDRGEPDCWRGDIPEKEADTAARKAVFRALSQIRPRSFDSIVIVLDRP